MLISIRQKAGGWIGWAIAGVIVLAIGSWGISSWVLAPGKIVVATAEGIEIEQLAYQQTLAQQRRTLVQLTGSNLDAAYFSTDEFKRQVLDQLIDETLRAAYINSRRYRISDQELNRQIQEISVFQKDGAFDTDRYQELVDRAGLSIAIFEEQQRRQGLFSQIESSFVTTAFASSTSVNRALELLLQERSAHYAILTLDPYLKQAKVTDAEVNAEYEGNSESYYLPAEIQIDYLELSVAELATKILLDEDEIRRVYVENQERFSQPTSRRVSHILISVDAEAEEATVQAAQFRAAKLGSDARSGADFSNLAEAHSDDTGSARLGGDLGVIQPGVMPVSFEKTVLSLNEGDVSDPVRTDYGFHVIKLTRLIEKKIEAYEDVREQIASEIKRREAESRFVEMAEDLRNISYEQPDSLEPAALALQLDIKRSAWFSQESADGLAAPAVIREAAFSDEVLVDALNSEVIEVDVDTLVVMRKAEYRGRQLQALSQVRGKVVDHLRGQSASSALDQAGLGVVSRLRRGASWDKLLSEYGLEGYVLPPTETDTEDPIIGGVRSLVYAAPPPGKDEFVYGGNWIGTGQFAIYKLTSVTGGDPTMVSSEQKLQVQTLMLRRSGEELLASFQRGLREAADVTIYPDQL